MSKKRILFLNPVPLIKFGIMYGFKSNGWDTYLMEGEHFVLNQNSVVQIIAIEKYIDTFGITHIFWDFGVGADFKSIYNFCKYKGVKFCIWGIEDTPEMTCWLDQTINHCHYYFTTTSELIPYAKEKYNKNIKLLTFGVNPNINKSDISNPELYTCDIALVANNYSSRYEDFNDFILPLIEKGYNINIWGNNWWMDKSRPVNLCNYPYIYKGYMDYNEACKLYSTCKIGIGLQCCRTSESQMSMRFAEIMGVGHAIFICPWSPALENTLGKSGEFAFFPKTQTELIQNVDYVLQMSDDERRIMALKAQNLVYSKEDYKIKIKEIEKYIL